MSQFSAAMAHMASLACVVLFGSSSGVSIASPVVFCHEQPVVVLQVLYAC
jgi:hypothetical protein